MTELNLVNPHFTKDKVEMMRGKMACPEPSEVAGAELDPHFGLVPFPLVFSPSFALLSSCFHRCTNAIGMHLVLLPPSLT